MSYRRAALAAGLALAAAFGLAACVVSPPRLLSLLDGADGGNAGVELAASRAFGTHGQQLDVWRPRRVAGSLPVVIFFYGGGWVKGTRAGYAFAGRAFAGQGFVMQLLPSSEARHVRRSLIAPFARHAISGSASRTARL